MGVPTYVDGMVEFTEDIQEECIFGIMERVREVFVMKGASDEQRSNAQGEILLLLENYGEAMYKGGLMVGEMARTTGVDINTLWHAPPNQFDCREPIFEVLAGGIPGRKKIRPSKARRAK